MFLQSQFLGSAALLRYSWGSIDLMRGGTVEGSPLMQVSLDLKSLFHQLVVERDLTYCVGLVKFLSSLVQVSRGTAYTQ